LGYGAGDIAAAVSACGATSRDAFEFQAQNGRAARRRQAKSTALKKKRP
jgi:hypothetical protein